MLVTLCPGKTSGLSAHHFCSVMSDNCNVSTLSIKKKIKNLYRCPKFWPCPCDEDFLLCSQPEAMSCRRSIHRHVEHHQLLTIRREGEEISQVEKKPLSSLTMPSTFIHLLLLTTHHSPSVSTFLLLSTLHISPYYSSGHKQANDRAVFSFLILAGETMISTHTSEPLNSSSNFSVFPTVNSNNFSFSFMLKKAEFNQLIIKK